MINYTTINTVTNVIRYRIVESSAMKDIVAWAVTYVKDGSDVELIGPLKQYYVTVPDHLLMQFLETYGWAVSADLNNYRSR